MFGWLKNKAVKVQLGKAGEQLARVEYEKNGYEILAANFFNRKGRQVGEIDFIAKSRDCLVFVEVKTRSGKSGRFGSGAEAVNNLKQQRILKAAKLFLAQNPELRNLTPRVDVCLVESREVDNSGFCVTIITNAVEDS